MSRIAAALRDTWCPCTKAIKGGCADHRVCARTLFYFKTNRNAPRYKLITIDITESAEANWKDVLSHQEAVLNDVVCVGKGKYFVTCYMMHARETLDLYSVEGNKVQEIPLPDVGSVGSLAAPAAPPS